MITNDKDDRGANVEIGTLIKLKQSNKNIYILTGYTINDLAVSIKFNFNFGELSLSSCSEIRDAGRLQDNKITTNW